MKKLAIFAAAAGLAACARGNAVIDAWLRSRGRDVSSLNAVERLCYTGTRGMGALEYEPALLDESAEGERVEVEALAALADEVLNARRGARAELDHGSTRFAPILKVGSSAGGARVIIGEVRDAVARWREFADVAEVLPAHARHIADRLSRAS